MPEIPDEIENALQRTYDQQVGFAFLALTVWREARGESRSCQTAVAYSILNRVDHPGWWGKNDILSVIGRRLQYSSMTYQRDPQLTTWPLASDPSWRQCLDVAAGAIHGIDRNPTPGADSYYDISISAPKWAAPECFVGQVGRIRFYNTDHDHDDEGAVS